MTNKVIALWCEPAWLLFSLKKKTKGEWPNKFFLKEEKCEEEKHHPLLMDVTLPNFITKGTNQMWEEMEVLKKNDMLSLKSQWFRATLVDNL